MRSRLGWVRPSKYLVTSKRVLTVESNVYPGIHNEPGVKTMRLPKRPELVRLMLNYITSTTDTERSFLPFQHDGGDQVVLLVNNLGGLSEMELAAIAGEALVALKERGIKVARVGAGRYMVSPDDKVITHSDQGVYVLKLLLGIYRLQSTFPDSP